MARNGALRRAGPPVVVGLALVLGGITVGYGWIVARHLRDDARQTSALLGRVFAGLNDPGPDAAQVIRERFHPVRVVVNQGNLR